jgi:signal transduction histidine kinase/CheY-like chemotaxis protein
MGMVPDPSMPLDAAQGSARVPRQRLRAKLLRIMLSIVVPLSLATLGCIAWLQFRATVRSTQHVQRLLREGIRDKGRVLANSHALALSGLVSDNAFGDVSELVLRATRDDPDIVYGLFMSSDGSPWAYVAPTVPGGASTPQQLERWKELALPEPLLHPAALTERSVRLFDQPILEFASPVRDRSEDLGTIRYGLSTTRLGASLADAQADAHATLRTALLILAGLFLLNTGLGVVLIRRASGRISEPLQALTNAANAIAAGRRDVRAEVASDDELALLAFAFNQMLEVNQHAFEQLEETTERALEAARIKSAFLANMSHEIRTPMNGVMGVAKLMLEMPLDGKLRRYAETIDVSATSLLTIINDVLDFSKMEAGKYVITKVAFDPRLVVQDVAELLATPAYAKGLELIYRVAPEVPELVVGDADRVRQVLNNLLGNAVKFTERGEVYLDVGLADEDDASIVLRFEISDTGIGIEEQERSAIFEAFSQVDGSTARKHGGTGLGLAISKRLVEMMGGQIGLGSRPGVGSQFWFTLRVERAARHAALARERHPALPAGKHTLVIEANGRWCDVIREHLEAWGAVSECVASGELALSRVSERGKAAFDVVIIGAQTGQLGLRDLILGLREATAPRKVPLLLLHPLGTTVPTADVETEVLAQLAKPLRMSDLYNALQDAVTGRRARREAPQARKTPATHAMQKVLVVDDNEINQFVAVEQLNRFGYQADVARDGAQAIEMVQRNDYALVLMDCQMPVMDGYQATRAIRAHEGKTGKHQRIVALTAHAMSGERDRVLAAGMDDYLSKPLRPSSLERLLARYLHSDEGEPRASSEPVSASSARERPIARSEKPVLAPDIARSGVLIEMCLKQMPQQLAAVEAALSRVALAELRAAAHKLKGSAMAIAADALAELAEALQRKAEQASIEDVPLLVARLHSQYGLVEEALKKELRQRPST